MTRSTAYELPLVDVVRRAGGVTGDPVVFRTISGDIVARYHPIAGGLATRGAVLVPGVGGGLDGPAPGFYAEVAEALGARGIEALRLDYRRVNRLEECVRDALVGAHWLSRERGIDQVALIGHSFGGAVAITAGVAGDEVGAVAALASQAAGAEAVTWLGKPLFLAHGDADEVLPVACSLRLAQRANGEVACRIYPGAHHALAECRGELIRDLATWLDTHL